VMTPAPPVVVLADRQRYEAGRAPVVVDQVAFPK